MSALAEHAPLRIERAGRAFQVGCHASSADGRMAFLGGAEAATLGFFDAVLPSCARMIDVGAYVGFMSLYAATQVTEVHAVEASPSHQSLLRDNLALNPALAARITVHPVAVGDGDGTATLFRKGFADSGTSVFETVERTSLVRGQPEAEVPRRDAAALLAEIGIDRTSLVKIDIEGAEYAVLPAIADLLARRLPFLQVSFHPFNLLGADAYCTDLVRLRAGLEVAAALACYRYIYLYRQAVWREIGPDQRTAFLSDHLLTRKPVPRVGSSQFGFVDAVGFSPIRLPALAAA